MNLFGFLDKKTPAVTYRLQWFELQVNPMVYRFAIMPEQPILIGLPGENGEKGSVLLVRYDQAPETYTKIVESIDTLVRQHKLLSLPMKDPGLAFQEAAMNTPGTHLRLAYADKTSWAGAFPAGTEPSALNVLVEATKTLAKQVKREIGGQIIDGDKAMEHIKRENNSSQKNSPAIVLRVKVSADGKIFVNRQAATLANLHAALDELKTKNGEVWYHREVGTSEPPEATVKVIKQVLDAVMSRKLPIRLQEEEI